MLNLVQLCVCTHTAVLNLVLPVHVCTHCRIQDNVTVDFSSEKMEKNNNKLLYPKIDSATRLRYSGFKLSLCEAEGDMTILNYYM